MRFQTRQAYCSVRKNIFITLIDIGLSKTLLILGFVLDKFGLLSCRLLGNIPMTIGLILMIFFRSKYCLILGIELIAFAGMIINNTYKNCI